MDLEQLRSFVVLAESGTMTLAAQRLFITQSALSRQVKVLEAELGVVLFDRERGRRRLSLTYAGERVLAQARTILGQTHQLHVLVDGLREAATGLVRVAAPPASLRHVVLPTLRAFKEQSPEIDVEPMELMQDLLFPLVEAGRADLAVVNSGSVPAQLSAETLFSARLYALVSPQHRLAAAESLTAEELSEERLLQYRFSQSAQFARAHTFQRVTFEGRLPAPEIDSNLPETIFELAELGLGVAVISDVVPFKPYNLRAIPVLYQGRQIETPEVVAWQGRLSRPAAAFVDALKTYASRRETKGYRPWPAIER